MKSQRTSSGRAMARAIAIVSIILIAPSIISLERRRDACAVPQIAPHDGNEWDHETSIDYNRAAVCLRADDRLSSSSPLRRRLCKRTVRTAGRKRGGMCRWQLPNRRWLGRLSVRSEHSRSDGELRSQWWSGRTTWRDESPSRGPAVAHRSHARPGDGKPSSYGRLSLLHDSRTTRLPQ